MSPTEALQQRHAALQMATAKKSAIAALRRRINSEAGALEAVLLDPPDELADWLIFDVVRLAYSQRRSCPALERLGSLAARERVNLLVPLGRASLRTRRWVADNATWHWVASGTGKRRLYVEATS